MANRDLFRGMDAYDMQRRRETGGAEGRPLLQVWGRRLLAQAAAALLLFCGVVYLYEQESALGDGVRYIVALAGADEQEIMAVGSFADVWQNLLKPNDGLDEEKNDDSMATDEPVEPDNSLTAAAEYQPDAEYLQAAPGNAQGNLVMILPASGLMQSAFGDIDEQGLSVEGAAIGEVVEVVSGEKIVLRHRDGLISCYQGVIEPTVQVGETLRQGQLLGKITESTLLFQVLQDEQPLDPFLFIKGPE